MLERIIALSIRRRIVIVAGVAALTAAGLQALLTLRIDAVPDITPVQVVVNTRTGGLDPEQAERAVTTPVESEIGGIPGVQEVRSLTRQGLSQVVVTFHDGTDIYWARQQVTERIQGARESMPDGMAPEMAPITTGLGEVLMYVLLPKPDSPLAKQPEEQRLLYLRTVQDLVLRRHLKTVVAGVAEVDANGGFKKEIHVDVDPARLDERGLSIGDVVRQLETVGENFGGGYIQHEGRQITVRAVGTIDRLDSLRRLPVGLDVRGRPIRLGQVAAVEEHHAQRMGAATYNEAETVLGTVLMLSGADSHRVALDAERALAEAPLPADVEARIVYSRRNLVEATMRTVGLNLAEGAALVVVVLLLVLGNLRSALLVSLAIPVSMCCGALGMRALGISASLMSLGAVDFGLLVDASIVVVESVLRRLEERGGKPLDPRARLNLVLDACREVVRPVTGGLVLVTAVYLPVLLLGGIEGKMFRPMAETVMLLLATSLLVAVWLMPALAFLTLRVSRRMGLHDGWFERLRDRYKILLRWTLSHRRVTIAAACGVGLLALLLLGRLGGEFIPTLTEGDIALNMTREPDISLDASVQMQRKSERVLAEFKEARHVFSRIGTAEAATDPMGVNFCDTFVILERNRSAWPRVDGHRRSYEELAQALRKAVESEVKGQEVSENQPIQMRFGEILEGSRADVTLRLYGPNLDVLMRLQNDAHELLEKVPGAAEVELDPLTALQTTPVLNARLDYEAIARYGVEIGEVNRLLATAMGGKAVGSYSEGQWRFPIVVRLTEAVREDPAALTRLPVGLPDRGTVPLGNLATIEQRDQVTTIAHAGGARYAAVSVFLSGRDIQSFVSDAKKLFREKLHMPPDVTLAWGGQFKQLEAARGRLRFAVPAVLLGIFLVLLRNFGSFRMALLVYTGIPFAMTGGVFALAVRGIPFSVSAAVGFIALCGIALLNTIVLVTYINQLRAKRTGLADAVVQGALIRLRPVLMTALVASLGFVPMALNSGIGAEVQRPLATVVIGGVLSSTALTLLVVPGLYLLAMRHLPSRAEVFARFRRKKQP